LLFAVLYETGMRIGEALGYPAVYDLVRRLRRRTGICFDPHWCRHTAATRMLRDGVSIEVVSRLLGHADMTTTFHRVRAPDG
jgi:integrase/recombinase XerD